MKIRSLAAAALLVTAPLTPALAQSYGSLSAQVNGLGAACTSAAACVAAVNAITAQMGSLSAQEKIALLDQIAIAVEEAGAYPEALAAVADATEGEGLAEQMEAGESDSPEEPLPVSPA